MPSAHVGYLKDSDMLCVYSAQVVVFGVSYWSVDIGDNASLQTVNIEIMILASSSVRAKRGV